MHYVTERAVFELRPEGLTLTEIAPGIDIQTQVLDLMEFTPLISPDLKEMDTAIFMEGAPFGLRSIYFLINTQQFGTVRMRLRPEQFQ